MSSRIFAVLVAVFFIINFSFISLQALCEELVYYNPDGGQYYHAKPECKTMRSEYDPLMQAISVSELANAPYSSLSRCVHCFEKAEPTGQPTAGQSYFRHRDDWCNYDTAPEGFLLAQAGEYIAGKELPAGVYTIHGDGFTEGEIQIFSQSGDILHRFLVSGKESASFYLAENMRLLLPQGLTLQNITHVARFQSALEVADITSARYFMLLECPDRQYCVQSKPGMEGSVIVYSMDAEMGLSEPLRYPLTENEPITIDLSGLYNHFVELHNCLIWFTEEGVG